MDLARKCVPSLPFPSLPFPSLPFPSLPFPSLPSLPFPSLPFPSLPFPSLPFPSLPFPSLPFPSLPFLPCSDSDTTAQHGTRKHGGTWDPHGLHRSCLFQEVALAPVAQRDFAALLLPSSFPSSSQVAALRRLYLAGLLPLDLSEKGTADGLLHYHSVMTVLEQEIILTRDDTFEVTVSMATVSSGCLDSPFVLSFPFFMLHITVHIQECSTRALKFDFVAAWFCKTVSVL